MQLKLAIVQTCTRAGCQVRLQHERRDLDTLYSAGILDHQVEICPRDLVVVDTSAAPHRTVFCFARTQVESVQTHIRTDRHQGTQSPIDGLTAPLKPGDWVFATMGQVYDRCVDGLPADPDRLWTEARPMVESLVRPSEPAPKPDPTPAHTARTTAPQQVEYLTAETESGRQALQTVMDRSYHADLTDQPSEWALARLVDGVPVSYIVVNPDCELAMGGAAIRYAFVADVATRTDRRFEGHFRALMEHTYARLRQAGFSLLLLHGRYPLYRRLGFDVFTHHSGIFLTPEQIERALGTGESPEDRGLLQIEDHRGIQPDLLLVKEVSANSPSECAAALRAAASLARDKDKPRILFEHPPAPCGRRYQTHACPETRFTALARTCGAEVRLQGADPEGGTIPDADWIKVLDAAAFVAEVLACRSDPDGSLPQATLALDTDAGAVTLISDGHEVVAHHGVAPGAQVFHWPSSALAQLATGYRSVETLALLHGIELPPEAQALLAALFPPCWRFSRNESWTLRS